MVGHVTHNPVLHPEAGDNLPEVHRRYAGGVEPERRDPEQLGDGRLCDEPEHASHPLPGRTYARPARYPRDVGVVAGVAYCIGCGDARGPGGGVACRLGGAVGLLGRRLLRRYVHFEAPAGILVFIIGLL